MAWPGNNFNSFWEAMYGPSSHPPHGAGVDHAPPPPPPELPPFMNPDFWNRWSQRRGWEDFTGPTEGEGPWGHRGPPGRHPHAHGRRRGGRRHGHGGGDDEPQRGGPADDVTDNEAFPPEYITDDEVAAATAAAEAEKKGDKDASPDTMMRDETEDPPEEVLNPDESPQQRHGGRHGRRARGGLGREGFGGHPRRGGPRGPHHHGGPPPFGPGMFGGMFGGGPCRRGSRGPFGAHGHPHGPPPPFAPPFLEAFFGGPPHGPHGPGPHHHRGPPPPPPGAEGAAGPFDLRSMMGALANHPYAQHVREYLERLQQQGANNNRAATPDSSEDEMDADVIAPPMDLFEQADRWVLHLAVPGAKKEDVGVNWDADRSVLGVSGVVHRLGDEEFLRGLVSGERRVGFFAREVRLPPVEKEAEGQVKEEIDSEGITARMEDGVLIVTAPKVERDWTEVKRVEIE